MSKILLSKHKVCQICGNPKCGRLGVFHIFDKGRYPRLRYCRENLLVVGWLPCHAQFHQLARHDERAIKIEERIKALRGADYVDRLKALDALGAKVTPMSLSLLKLALGQELAQCSGVRMKYYIEEGQENCYPLDHFKELISLEGRESIKLELEKRDIGSGFIWCSTEGECFEQGNGVCGKFNCRGYAPRNGKNGRCKHAEVAFTGTGKFFILNKKGLKEVKL
jgi:hypothetical protein